MIYYAALEGNSKTLELLLAKAKEKGMSPREFGRALHTAAANKKSKSIALLLEYGADINQKDPGRDDRTPLMDACRTGSFEAARLLIKNGADVNAKDKDGNTAMTFCAADREDIVKLLKANGAVDKPPKPQKVEIKTLADAVEAGDGKAVEMFLRKGEDPNGVSHGDSLLRIAAKKAPGSVVKLLIDYGADLEARDDEITPLPAAVKAGNLGAALVLLEYGVNPNAYVQDDGVGADTTALDIASREKNDKMRRLLLRFGAEYSELIDRENFD
jgi:ankyrin repeat protein